jgi:hypothetical protein
MDKQKIIVQQKGDDYFHLATLGSCTTHATSLNVIWVQVDNLGEKTIPDATKLNSGNCRREKVISAVHFVFRRRRTSYAAGR